MASNGENNATSNLTPAFTSQTTDDSSREAPASEGIALNPTTTSRRRASSSPPLGRPIPVAGAFALRRSFSVGGAGFQPVGAAMTCFSGVFSRGVAAGLFGLFVGSSSAFFPSEDSDGDVDSEDLAAAGIKRENDFEDWDSDNHVSKKQRRE